MCGAGRHPVNEGLVASFNRPGGNITAASYFASVISGKALGLLRELVLNVSVIALMVRRLRSISFGTTTEPSALHSGLASEQWEFAIGRRRSGRLGKTAMLSV